jgi:hypothetical protein
MVDLDVQVALDDPPKQCVFCKQDIKEITINAADGSIAKYTKEEAIKEYIMFLNMLKEKTQMIQGLAEGKVKFEPKTMKG